jgi:penicillin-binding protein 2
MTARFDPEGRPPPKSGLLLLQGLIWVLFCIFALRFWYLQVHKGQEFSEMARDNQLRRESMYAPRGLIFDAKGRLVAVNDPAYALGVVREDVSDTQATLSLVSDWTGNDLAKIQERYNLGRRRTKTFEPLVLVSDLSHELLARIESNSPFHPGLEIVVRPRRRYPQGELLSHVLGYVAEANEEEIQKDPKLALGDNVGKGGLELILENRLRGDKGLRQLEVDATGRHLDTAILENPEAGENITLSIDLDLQRHCAKLMEGQAGAIVVMEPDTGKIRAFVSAPSYDNNLFVGGLSQKEWTGLRDDPMHPLQNRVVQSMFPPASVFKLVTGGLALAEKYNPEETVWCPGSWKFGRRLFRCWKKWGHGHVDLKEALIHSCDVYFYQVGDRLGVDKMSTFSKACGFGSKTGIDLPHEKGGLIPTRDWKLKRFKEPWQGGENLNFAIGQGYTLVTPLQVTRFISALINGGRLLKPQLLEGEAVVEQSVLPLDEAQRNFIIDAMVQTVEDGTARRLKRKDAVMGGKTGTAQVVRIMSDKRRKTEEMPYHERDHAWLASFGMKNGTSYAAVCMVEHGGHGSTAAGPVLKEVYNYLFGEQE